MLSCLIAVLFASLCCQHQATAQPGRPEGYAAYLTSGIYKRGPVKYSKGYTVPKIKSAYVKPYVELGSGKPLAVGVKITKSLLNNVFKMEPCTKLTPYGCSASVDVPFPPESPFKALGFMFNTEGHEPADVYTVPHFDIHFHLNTMDYINKNMYPQKGEALLCPGNGGVNATSPRVFNAAYKTMFAQCFPQAPYGAIPAFYNGQGNHLVDVTSPELAPNSTTKWSGNSWAFGAFDGRVNFFEPMVSLKYLKSKPTWCRTIPGLPFEFPEAGWYPTVYCIRTSLKGNVYIEMRSFIWYDAGCKAGAFQAGYTLADPTAFPAGCSVSPPPRK